MLHGESQQGFRNSRQECRVLESLVFSFLNPYSDNTDAEDGFETSPLTRDKGTRLSGATIASFFGEASLVKRTVY